MKPWLARSLLALTSLLVMGVAGCAGQVWWSKRVANSAYGGICAFDENSYGASPYCMGSEGFFAAWRGCPWWGSLGENPRAGGLRWHPRRIYLEHVRHISGLDLPNDPDACEAWFRLHPDLVWDEKQKRLVDQIPEGTR